MDLLNRQRSTGQPQKAAGQDTAREPAADLTQLRNDRAGAGAVNTKGASPAQTQRRDFQEKIHPGRLRDSASLRVDRLRTREGRSEDRREDKRRQKDNARDRVEQLNREDKVDDQQAVVGSRRSQTLSDRTGVGAGASEVGLLDPESQAALDRDLSAKHDPAMGSLAQSETLGVAPQEQALGNSSLTANAVGTSQSQTVELTVHRFRFAERGLANTPWMQELYRFFANSERDVLGEEERDSAERALLEFDRLSPAERTPEKILEILQLSGVAAPTYQKIGEILREMGADAPGSQEQVGSRALSVLENKDKMERIVFDPSNN